MDSSRNSTILVSLFVLSMVAAACSTTQATPTSTTNSTSSTSTTSLSKNVSVLCSVGGWSTDLDGVGADEMVVLNPNATGGYDLAICSDGAILASTTIEVADTELLGFVDLGDGGSLDILVGSRVGDRVDVRAASVLRSRPCRGRRGC